MNLNLPFSSDLFRIPACCFMGLRYISLAKENGYLVIGYYFQSSISACKERNSQRTGKALLPVSALAATHRILELPDWDEGFDELYAVKTGPGHKVWTTHTPPHVVQWRCLTLGHL